MKLSARCLLITVIAFSAASFRPPDAAAQDDPPKADKTLSPYFFVEGGDPSIDMLPLKDTRVDVSIAGVIADVTVRQIYENGGPRPIHARYVFPASTRAAVYGMTMTVGNVRTVAKIKERETAVREFETAKREGKNASLLEQSRPNVFTMKLANVMPNDTIVVELKYTELLVPTDGMYEFVYPTVVGPRYSSKREREAAPQDAFVKAPYTHQGALPRSEFHFSGKLSTGVPLQELMSPSHQLVTRETGGGHADVSLAETERFSGNRDVILRYRLAGREIASGLLLHEDGNENFFLLMAQPPQAVAPDQVPPREYIFVLDVSGSMNGFPLDTAKELMGDLAKVLKPTDTFNIVVFASGSETYSRVSVPATSANLARAMHFIGAKNGGGGTELLAALQRAVAIERKPGVSRSVVLVSDGYIEAESDVFDYVRDQRNDVNCRALATPVPQSGAQRSLGRCAVNFFAFGIGSSVNRFLIEGVAKAGLGEPFIVTQPHEAADAAAQLRQYIDTPVLTGIDVKFEGFDAYDVEPGTVPDLFASRPIVVFGKYRGQAAGSIEISGTTGAGAYRTSIPVSSKNVDANHVALRYLWARTRIANLSDFGPATPSQERVNEITGLGLAYGLLTKYTSFVAVQEVVRNTEGAPDVDQPLPLPEGVSDRAVGVTAGPEPDLPWVIAMIAALFAAGTLLRMRNQRTGVAA